MIDTPRLDAALSATARLLWPLASRLNRLIPAGVLRPLWASGPFLRSRERSFPPLGLPRETDSLCPGCVAEVRARVLEAIDRGDAAPLEALRSGHPGEVKATIREVSGSVVMEKTCPRHGRFEEVLETDAAFFRRMERLYPGRDFPLEPDSLHDHGPSAIRYGRGAVLTIDLTNRCNMMCGTCFMDANQVGYVHELTLDEVKRILGDAAAVRPRRQLSVQLSGGEPTLSPIFLDACRAARDAGFFSVQCASNGLRFAEDPEFARAAKEAGLRFVYLQFDGVTNASNACRGVANLFDVKERAIENIHNALMSVALVVTVSKGVNDDQVGPIVEFAIRNIDRIHTISFQPVSFSGREEDLPAAERNARHYTVSDLARDLERQTGLLRPLRDWFPLSASSLVSDLADLVQGTEAPFGNLKCGCHPDCGAGAFLLVHKGERRAWPVTSFLDLEGLLEDLRAICDGARPPALTRALAALALLARFDPRAAPAGFRIADLATLFGSKTGASDGGAAGGLDARAHFPWKTLFVGGMRFQDLFSYDLRRTEMCAVPYATQLGEVSFCAYNTGLGWRKFVERLHRCGSVRRWYREHGRHAIHAKGVAVPLPEPTPAAATLRGEWQRGEVALAPAAGGGGTEVVYREGPAKRARPKPLPLVKVQDRPLTAGVRSL